jgi:mannose-6-phosphate isomerase
MNKAEKLDFNNFRKSIKTSSFTNKPYVRKIPKPWGWELHFTPDDLPYMGKILHINAGMRISLQVHDKKQESWYKLSGDAILIAEDTRGKMTRIKLKEGVGYNLSLGQKHRLSAGHTDAEFLEVSTPENGNTYRLEDDFSRSTETVEERSLRNKLKL